MHESTLIPLKVLVERAVRPLHASASYKQRTREEMLAHVLSVFQEELARLGDERAALESTVQRFGDAGDLTRQLQQTVPPRDALQRLGEGLFGFGPSRSTWRRSIRHGLSAAVHAALVFGMIGLVMPYIVPQRHTDFMTLMLVMLIICVCIFVSGLLFLSHWAAQVLFCDASRSWRRGLPIAAASGLLLPIATFAVCLGLSGEVWSSLRSALPLAAGYMLLNLVLTPLIVIVIAWRLSMEIRTHDEWASLSLE